MGTFTVPGSMSDQGLILTSELRNQHGYWLSFSSLIFSNEKCGIHSLVLFILVSTEHQSVFATLLPEPTKRVYRKMKSLWKSALVKIMSRKSGENIRKTEENVKN